MQTYFWSRNGHFEGYFLLLILPPMFSRDGLPRTIYFWLFHVIVINAINLWANGGIHKMWKNLNFDINERKTTKYFVSFTQPRHNVVTTLKLLNWLISMGDNLTYMLCAWTRQVHTCFISLWQFVGDKLDLVQCDLWSLNVIFLSNCLYDNHETFRNKWQYICQ